MPRKEQWFWTAYFCVTMWVCWWSFLGAVTPYYYKAPTAEPYVEYYPPYSGDCLILQEAELRRIENNTAKIIFGGWQDVDMRE